MKHLSLLFVTVLLSCLVCFTGCSPSGGSSPASSYFMKATIGSASMDGTSCVATVVSGTLAISGSTVSGGVGGPPQINITIGNWSGSTGTFTLTTASSATNSFGQYIAASGSTAKLSNSGSVTLTSVSATEIKGTFDFTCTDGTVVSAGSFTAQRS